MLKSHMDAKERALVTISKIPANAGHPLHKGTPREAFVREFLAQHLPSNVDIGMGEIIDANSQPGQPRNQFDIVVYKKSCPKLEFGGGISGFLVESVIATIEVKSTLTKEGFEESVKAAKNGKSLIPNVTSTFQTGYIPPRILNYVVAYDGPASMKTVYGWISPTYAKLGIEQSNLPSDEGARLGTPAEALDGVFVLEKGFLYYDNVPVGFGNIQNRQQNPTLKWIFAESQTGNLLLFFVFLLGATANIEAKWVDVGSYLQNFSVQGPQWGS